MNWAVPWLCSGVPQNAVAAAGTSLSTLDENGDKHVERFPRRNRDAIATSATTFAGTFKKRVAVSGNFEKFLVELRFLHLAV